MSHKGIFSKSKLYKAVVSCSCGKVHEYDIDVPLEHLDEIATLRKELDRMIKTAEDLKTWCIEPDKKFIYEGYIKQAKDVLAKVSVDSK